MTIYIFVLTDFGLNTYIFFDIFELPQASRFRKLIGTMSPPDDTDMAEIYVEVRIRGFVVVFPSVLL